jgi:peptide/nickel transport system permease protein
MSFLNYALKRILATIPILFGVLLITFVLVRIIPGTPFNPNPETKFDPEVIENLRIYYGLDKPVLVQFWIYIKNIAQGDWGMSLTLSKGQPVWELMWEKVPLTLEINIITTILSSWLGIKLGVFSAVNHNNMKDTVVRFLAFVFYSMPSFWFGIILQYLFTYKLDWFPSQGYMAAFYDEIMDNYTVTGFGMVDTILAGKWEIWLDVLHHLFLPIFVLTIGSIAGLTRYVRSSMLEVLELDFIRSARAKGCKERDVVNKHALKNSMIPTVTLIGMSFGYLVIGSTLIEQTFSLNGMGRLYLDCIENNDYFVIQAMVILITGMVIVANLITDIMYGVLDPRIRY